MERPGLFWKIRGFAMTLRPSLHPHRTSWARKQPPSLLIPVFCAMILRGVGGTLPFYIPGKEFQAIPQKGQDSWPPEVQLWGNSHSLCSQDQRHPRGSLGSREPPSVAAVQHWARAPWCTACRGLCSCVLTTQGEEERAKPQKAPEGGKKHSSGAESKDEGCAASLPLPPALLKHLLLINF